MKIYIFNNLINFKCIANKCKHSCCAGWEIFIDKKSISLYRKLAKKDEKLKNDIDYKQKRFKISSDKVCPFLHNGLCDIFTKYGEKSLCQVCTDHPRFRNFYSDRVEMGFGLCCEESARLIITAETKLEYTLIFDDKKTKKLNKLEAETLAYRQRVFDAIYSDFGIEKTLINVCSLIDTKLQFFALEKFENCYSNMDFIDSNFSKKLQNLSLKNINFNNLNCIGTQLKQVLSYYVYRYIAGKLTVTDIKENCAFAIFMFLLIICLCNGNYSLENLIDNAREVSAEIEYSDNNFNEIMLKIEENIPLFMVK